MAVVGLSACFLCFEQKRRSVAAGRHGVGGWREGQYSPKGVESRRVSFYLTTLSLRSEWRWSMVLADTYNTGCWMFVVSI